MRIYITARYAHLARESVKTSAAKAAESIGSDMVGSQWLLSGLLPGGTSSSCPACHRMDEREPDCCINRGTLL